MSSHNSITLNFIDGTDLFMVLVTSGKVCRIIQKDSHGGTVYDTADLSLFPNSVQEYILLRVSEEFPRTSIPHDYEEDLY